MTSYKYQQIICCSSQKNLTTGLSGFGVRAISPGLSMTDAEEIYLTSGIRYGIPVNKMATAEIIRDNPLLESLYPHIYSFCAINLSNGTTKYLVSRVMYAGADYGFFDDSEFNNRVGTNYIAHILVFERKPPVRIVAAVLSRKLFLPVNTECTYENAEFKKILTGENFPLPEGCIELEALEDNRVENVDKNLLIALLQRFKNQKQDNGNSTIKDIICKAPHAQVDNIIISLGSMPPQLTDNLYFNANAYNQRSVPSGLHLMITNEKDDTETLDDYHIVTDQRKGISVFRNIEPNFILDKIKELPADNIEALRLAAGIYMQLCEKNDANYEQAYRIISVANAKTDIQFSNITNIDIALATTGILSELQEHNFWNNINNAINQAFEYPCKMQELKSSLRIIAEIQKYAPERVPNLSKYGHVLNHIMFGTPTHFHDLLEDDSQRIDTVLDILRKSSLQLPAESDFLNAVSTSKNAGVWDIFLRYYYGEGSDCSAQLNIAVNTIMANYGRHDWVLATELFPVAEYYQEWLFFVNNNPEGLSLIRDDLDKFLLSKLNDNAMHTAEIVLQISPVVISQLSNPIKNIPYIHSNQIISHPTLEDLTLACKLKSPHEYITALFSSWIAEGATKEEISSFISSYSKNAQTTAELLEIYWTKTPSRKREAKLLWISDHIKFQKYNMKDIKSLIRDKDLIELLNKENGFIKKIFRRILGLRFCLIIIGYCTIMISCSKHYETHREYITPFLAEYYGELAGVMQVTIEEYNKAGLLTTTVSRKYSELGQLLMSTLTDSNGLTDSTSYVYNEAGKLTSIENKNVKYSDFRYTDGQLEQFRAVSFPNGQEDIRNYIFKYNNLNKLSEQLVTEGQSDTLQWYHYDYFGSGKIAAITEITRHSLTETLFDSISGHVTSIKVYSYPQGKLKIVRNFAYGKGEPLCDLESKYTVKITNSRGQTQGKLLITYDNYNISSEIKEINPRTDVAQRISEIPKPAPTQSLLTNYVNGIKYRIAVNNVKSTSPNNWLMLIVFFITAVFIYLYIRIAIAKSWYKPFSGNPLANGMKRLWMFNSAPYSDVALTLTIILAAFVSAVLLLLGVGAVTYGILWILKLIIVILIWIGWISLVLGIVGVFGGGGGAAILLGLFGGVIVYFEDGMRSFGESLVNWGFDFMTQINIFEWGKNLFVDFWDVILLCYATPMVIFIAIAGIIIALVALLSGFDWIVMKFYRVKRPCPVCGGTEEKEYWADSMHKHPVKLRPGLYGVFSHVEPKTSKSMPTLLINGKGRLLRKCPNCNNFITSDSARSFGTEKHIGIVGNRSSGKSYLSYTMLDRILNMYGTDARQIDSDPITNIAANITRVRNGHSIQTDDLNSYRAVQLLVQPKLRPVPYHIFLYDVAGEKFNQKSNSSKTAMEFYRNVEQIVFVVDPTTIDYSYSPSSPTMEQWLSRNASPERFSIDGIFSTLRTILDSVGRKTKSIDFMFALVKVDKGYLKHCGYRENLTPEEIKTFIQRELGLGNIINAATGTYKKVDFVMTSVRPEYSKSIISITERVLHNIGIK